MIKRDLINSGPKMGGEKTVFFLGFIKRVLEVEHFISTYFN